MPDEMSAAAFDQALNELGLKDNLVSARAFDSDERTVRRWRTGKRGVPGPAAQLARLWLSVKRDRRIPTLIKLRILPATE